MAKTYRQYDPKQSFLLPPSLDDWLPEGHLARFVSDTIDAIDLAPFYAYYEREERGYPPYHPSMMVKLLVYGYCVGTRSSRKIEQACIDQVAFRWLGAGNLPKHSAIADFRATHIERIDHLFVEILQLAQRGGLVKLATVAIDGTKMKANAALDKNRSLDALKEEEARLRERVKAILDEAEAIDKAEDELYGKDNNPYFLPEGLRSKKERLERIQQAKKELEQEREEAALAYENRLDERREKEAESGKKLRGRKPKEPRQDAKAKRNTTDVQSRIMKSRQGYVQGYNAQAAVDADSLLIVGGLVTNEANDMHQQDPVLDNVKKNIGRLPKRALLDAGYWNERKVKAAPDEVEMFVATTKDHRRRKALQEEGPPRGRIPKGASFKQRMERKLRTKKGAGTYKLRSRTVEPVFGRIKDDQGIRGFLLRGLRKVGGEWGLVSTAYNVKRLWRMGALV